MTSPGNSPSTTTMITASTSNLLMLPAELKTRIALYAYAANEPIFPDQVQPGSNKFVHNSSNSDTPLIEPHLPEVLAGMGLALANREFYDIVVLGNMMQKNNDYVFRTGTALLKFLVAMHLMKRQAIRRITLHLNDHANDVHALNLLKTCTGLQVLTLDISSMGPFFHYSPVGLQTIFGYQKIFELRGLKKFHLSCGQGTVKQEFLWIVLSECRLISPYTAQDVKNLMRDVDLLEQELTSIVTQDDRIPITEEELERATAASNVWELPGYVVSGGASEMLDDSDATSEIDASSYESGSFGASLGWRERCSTWWEMFCSSIHVLFPVSLWYNIVRCWRNRGAEELINTFSQSARSEQEQEWRDEDEGNRATWDVL